MSPPALKGVGKLEKASVPLPVVVIVIGAPASVAEIWKSFVVALTTKYCVSCVSGDGIVAVVNRLMIVLLARPWLLHSSRLVPVLTVKLFWLPTLSDRTLVFRASVRDCDCVTPMFDCRRESGDGKVVSRMTPSET